MSKNISPEDVKNHIKVVPDFPNPGINFLDINPLLADPMALRYAIADMCILARENGGVDRIGAFDSRGFLFGVSMAEQMHKPFFPIRKAGKLAGECVQVSYGLEYGSDVIEIQKASVKPGERILLVDDVLATGGTLMAGAKLVEELGGEVAGCVFLLELSFLDGPKKVRDSYNVNSLAKYSKEEMNIG